MAPRRDKQPINSNGNETSELSYNIESKLNDLIERMEKDFQMMPGVLGDVLLKVHQPIVENVRAN